MARHITYQFDSYFATYDKNTEQDRIDEVEAKGDYIAKFPVTIADREKIDSNDVIMEVIDNELVLTEYSNVDPMLAINWPGGGQ